MKLYFCIFLAPSPHILMFFRLPLILLQCLWVSDSCVRIFPSILVLFSSLRMDFFSHSDPGCDFFIAVVVCFSIKAARRFSPPPTPLPPLSNPRPLVAQGHGGSWCPTGRRCSDRDEAVTMVTGGGGVVWGGHSCFTLLFASLQVSEPDRIRT